MDEWEKVTETLTASEGHGQRWSDVTADKILADIRRMTKSIKKMKKLPERPHMLHCARNSRRIQNW